MAAAPKFLLDTHIKPGVADGLRQRGVDVVRCEDVGLRTALDPELLAFAEAEQRTIVTHDLHFPTHHEAWLRQGRHHFGILLCQPYLQGDAGIGRIIGEVMMYHEFIRQDVATIEEELVDQILFVS